MKPFLHTLTLFFFALVTMAGCTSSDDQAKRVVKVGTEIAALQQQYYPAISELGKVAVQIEAIAQRQDKTTKAMAGELATANEMIAAAFTAGQSLQKSFPVSPNQDVELYISASEANKALLQDALDKTTAAVRKSHVIIEALSKANTGGKVTK